MNEPYNVNVNLDEPEAMEMAGMAWSIDNWSDDMKASPMGRVFQKIKNDMLRQFNGEQLLHLDKITAANKQTFSEPPIERGMLQGGFDGLMERLNDAL